MKIAPLYHALKREPWAEPIIVHTGQHYDLNMSDSFFEDLGLPEPDIHLGAGSGTHAEQTGRVMIAYEKAILESHPDLVIVVGDVNSTVACTLTASKITYPTSNTKKQDPRRKTQDSRSKTQHPTSRTRNSKSEIQNPKRRTQLPEPGINHPKSNIQTKKSKIQNPKSKIPKRPLIAHMEAGLRSFDRTMPEEINRLVTDALADILWTPSPDADENLIKEGIPPEKIHCVGNIMIDSLEMLREKIQKQAVYEEFGLEQGKFCLVTLHRPSNVDQPEILESICRILADIGQNVPIVFPIHPRTRKNLKRIGAMSLLTKAHGLYCVKPMSYIRFMNLVFNCRLAITDSGGIQEETTYLGIPCLTMRPNTERPITIKKGTNQLCKLEDLEKKVKAILSGKVAHKSDIDLWDGKTANRVVKSIKKFFGK
jgi:UDP-N-acetylglucosamine 2-epimerase (non-hydrolysing)